LSVGSPVGSRARDTAAAPLRSARLSQPACPQTGLRVMALPFDREQLTGLAPRAPSRNDNDDNNMM